MRAEELEDFYRFADTLEFVLSFRDEIEVVLQFGVERWIDPYLAGAGFVGEA